MLQHFQGTGVAIVTPFNNNGIDFSALGKIIDFQIAGGIDFMVSLGSTGEASTCSEQECRAILDYTIERIDGRVPLVAGNFGHNNTAALVSKIEAFSFDGIDAILSSAPSYNRPTQQGIFAHFCNVIDTSPVPVILYNVPGRTAVNINPETTLRLAEYSENCIAVKEASGSLDQAMEIVNHKPENFLLLSGDDLLALPIISCGGDGLISVIANAFPSQFSNLVRSALKGDFLTAQKIQLDLLDVHPLLYEEGNPAGIKAAMEILGFCSKNVRLPLTSYSAENYQKLQDLMMLTTKV